MQAVKSNEIKFKYTNTHANKIDNIRFRNFKTQAAMSGVVNLIKYSNIQNFKQPSLLKCNARNSSRQSVIKLCTNIQKNSSSNAVW